MSLIASVKPSSHPYPHALSPNADPKTVLSEIYRGMRLHPGCKSGALPGQHTAYKFGVCELLVSVGVGT